MEALDYLLSDGEVKKVLFSFKSFKAPGPDGFHPHFYQYHWKSMGSSIHDCCHQIFHTQHILEVFKTYLCLIPKFKNANHLKKICHIGLCNTIYKIITKIIANHIKPLLPSLIGPHQTSFLKGHRTCDNVILVQEIYNYLNKIASKKG